MIITNSSNESIVNFDVPPGYNITVVNSDGKMYYKNRGNIPFRLLTGFEFICVGMSKDSIENVEKLSPSIAESLFNTETKLFIPDWEKILIERIKCFTAREIDDYRAIDEYYFKLVKLQLSYWLFYDFFASFASILFYFNFFLKK